MTTDPLSTTARPRIIQTPWGELRPVVDLLPLWYILVLYGIIYFLPFGVFEFWRKGEDGPTEWFQFAGYAGAFIFSMVVLWRRRRAAGSRSWLAWLGMALFCLYVAGEEISWGERISSVGLEAVRELNKQGETNIHNLAGVQSLLSVSFIASCLFFGYLGWRFWPGIDAWPARRFSLYFLPVALFYTYWDLSWITLGDRIRNDQEALELMIAFGLFLHTKSVALRSDSHGSSHSPLPPASSSPP